ncbi:hypothetical protein CK203_026321 [Vitis vinifera]|uniref:Uncharacterized protein n=1 Tax=Vitis vinifera TaxID=29760 RepID=A0A438IL21_VITVI|nr:hypothetical protein CK203_026321 [Vitis vinifera]
MVVLQLQQPNYGISQGPSLQRRRQRALRTVCLQTQALPSRTQRIMESISVSGEVGGAGGAYSYSALKRLDQLWSSICSAQTVCGGTLGIFIATALSSKGLRVGVVERNILKGEQEWNISRKELLELVEAGILVEDDIKQVTAAKFNPNRCGFEGKGEIWVEDILNLGVSPVKLIEVVKRRFTSLGGVIFEGYSVSNICIYEDAAVLQLAEGNILSTRLLIDAMGNFSPVPDGVCLVVGSCARGFTNNSTSDVIYSSSSVKKVGESEVQYFWEAFPAGSGPVDRTTYMFTYVDPQPKCPKLEDLLEDYWDMMPEYQGRLSPLPAAFDRILQFGDASGIQSPVSFGGFGSLTRHLERLSTGIYEAITGNFLDSYNLSLLNPYMPNLSAAWLFQRAMSAKQQYDVSPDFISELLYVNFQSMQRLGDPVLRPFLQDVIQFGPLVKTLGLVMLSKPQILPSIFKQVGVPVLLDWSGHFVMLGYYTFLSTFIDPAIRPLINAFPAKMKYKWKRYLEAWKYGAGLDYKQ